jgi:light-regulated signal transduction histidine kinase (bacteriophytochrome)
LLQIQKSDYVKQSTRSARVLEVSERIDYARSVMPVPVRASDSSTPRTERPRSTFDAAEFILRACHDLRASTRAVRTQSELLQRHHETSPDSALHERLGLIVEGAQQLDLIVDGLAAYSLALQTDPASFRPISMGVLLRSVLMKLNRELLDCGAEVSYGDLPVVTGNPDRLMQVLENLLRNALQHRGSTKPHIEITAAGESDSWLIGVRDNGTGVEAGYLEKIFMPFERLRGVEHHGVGLGLAICRVIVERHGGRIWAESGAGGATFFFTLPGE